MRVRFDGRFFPRTAVTILFLLIGAPASLWAAESAYEGFDAPPGTSFGTALDTGATSFGWAHASYWTHPAGETAAPPFEIGTGVTYPGLATSSSGAAFGNGYPQAFRTLATTYSSGTEWISFVTDSPDSSLRYTNLGLYDGSEEVISFGGVQNSVTNMGPAADYAIFDWASFKTVTTGVPLSAGAHLFVVKYSFPGGNTSADLWVDPSLATVPVQGTANWANFTTANFDTFNTIRVELNGWDNTDPASLDEIRIGTTFQDVVPTPEPSIGLFLLLGAAGWFGLSRFSAKTQRDEGLVGIS